MKVEFISDENPHKVQKVLTLIDGKCVRKSYVAAMKSKRNLCHTNDIGANNTTQNKYLQKFAAHVIASSSLVMRNCCC